MKVGRIRLILDFHLINEARFDAFSAPDEIVSDGIVPCPTGQQART
jgi:hypothetical protein